jgi:hypothetical protein
VPTPDVLRPCSLLAEASDRDAGWRELCLTALNHDLVGKPITRTSLDWLRLDAHVRLSTSGPRLKYPVLEDPSSNDLQERSATARRVNKFALVNLDVADLRKKEIGVLDVEATLGRRACAVFPTNSQPRHLFAPTLASLMVGCRRSFIGGRLAGGRG